MHHTRILLQLFEKAMLCTIVLNLKQIEQTTSEFIRPRSYKNKIIANHHNFSTDNNDLVNVRTPVRILKHSKFYILSFEKYRMEQIY